MPQHHKNDYANPRKCYDAVLAALDTLDPDLHGIKEVRIWRFADDARTSSRFGWYITTWQQIEWDTFDDPLQTRFQMEPPPKKKLNDRDRAQAIARWRAYAFEAWCEAEAAEQARETEKINAATGLDDAGG